MKALIIRVARKISLGMSFLILIFLFVLVVFWHSMVFTTPVGHTSIVWHRMLLTGERRSLGPLAEGLHIIAPWDVFYTYDLRLQKHRHDYDVVSKDGLHFDMELIFRWRVIRKNIRILNESTGPDYLEKMLVPEMGSVTRWVVANYTAEALYTAARAQVQSDIYDQAISDALPNGIGSLGDLTNADTRNVVSLVDVLISRIELPEKIRSAIEIKMIEAQVVAAYQFVLEREKLEKERKKIEAEGIRVFQETVAPAISESFLRWRGIEATLKLSQSPNTKVVVIGNSATGLPLILDTGEKSHPANDIPVTPLPQTQNVLNSFGPIQPGDSLWKIAGEVYRDQAVTRDQAMLVLLKANPEALESSCNVNAPLRVGATLRLPPAADVRQLPADKARREVEQQTRDWKEHLRTGRPLVCTSTKPTAALDDYLRDYQTAIDTFLSNQSVTQPAAAAKKSQPVNSPL